MNTINLTRAAPTCTLKRVDMSKRLARVKALPAEVVARLKENGIHTCKEFLTSHPFELMTILEVSFSQLMTLTATVSLDVAPKPQVLLAAYKSRQQSAKAFLPTSLHKLDAALHGGLPAGTITEVAGPPGCGKTQFCLMLSVVASLPPSLGGLGVSVAYIDTEAAFTAERLVQIAKSRYLEHFSALEHLAHLTESVHIFSELTCDGLSHRLDSLDHDLAAHGIGLVVIDSIASLVRKEFDTRSGRGVAERAALLTKQASRLKYLAEAFAIPIVVTNQVTTHLSHDWVESSDWSAESGAVVTAALGNSWSHCVNTRLVLEYYTGTRRILSVSKSPLCDCEQFVVDVEQRGLVLDWMATVELSSGQGLHRGDPAATSIAVRSDIEGRLQVAYQGQYPTHTA